MATPVQIPALIKQKIAIFEHIQPEYEACFRFMQEVHGRERLASFSVAQVVYYLHALWLCECKDRLLSIYEHMRRYEGHHCLDLLQTWQEGRSAEVVAFLTGKLNMLSFTAITIQFEEARNQPGDQTLAHRLEHGRLVLFTRGMNLLHALEAIFSLSEDELVQQVRSACQEYHHTPAQIDVQLAELKTPLYAYRPHQLLAQQNMVAMNRLDVNVLAQSTDMPGERSWRAASPNEPLAPFAEQVISGYLELSVPIHDNRAVGIRFAECSETARSVPHVMKDNT